MVCLQLRHALLFYLIVHLLLLPPSLSLDPSKHPTTSTSTSPSQTQSTYFVLNALSNFLSNFKQRPHLIQLHPTTTNRQKSLLSTQHGLKSLGHLYANPSTYLLYLNSRQAKRLQGDTRVATVDRFRARNDFEVISREASDQHGKELSEDVVLELVLARMYGGGPKSRRVVKKVKQAVVDDGDDVEVKTVSSRVIQVKIAGLGDVEGIRKNLKEVEGVVQVERRYGTKLLNMEAAAIGQSAIVDDTGTVNKTSLPIWRQNLLGQGETAAVGDTGVDLDSCYFRDTDTQSRGQFEGCDMKRRKIVCYFREGAAEFGDDGRGLPGGGHGSHIASSLAGLHAALQPSSNTKVTFDTLLNGSEYANGMAPLSKVAFTDIGATEGVQTPVDFATSDFFAKGYDNAKARVFSASWGCSEQRAERQCNRYDVPARSIDEFAHNNRDMLIIMAAGNTGWYPNTDTADGRTYTNGSYTVSSPATAKNVLSVGASQKESETCSDTGGECSIENIFGKSSRGRTFDGRTKPDLFFPGKDIISVTSSGNFADFSDGRSCRSADPGTGVHAQSGTSMTAPLVTGLALLTRQYYREFNPSTGKRMNSKRREGPLRDGKGPSAALIRATLINGARSFEGRYSFIPDNFAAELSRTPVVEDISDVEDRRMIEGFGRVQLDTVLKFEDENSSQSLFVFDRHKVEETGEEMKFVFDMAGSGDLKVTLCWTDPPGPLAEAFDISSTLVNNLDVRVTCEKTETGHCRDIDTGKPFAESKSSVDTVEQIDAGKTADPITVRGGGRLTVTVSAKKMESGPQPFSLVISGSQMTLNDNKTSNENWEPDWTDKAKLVDGSVLPDRTIWILAGVGGALLLAAAFFVISAWMRKRHLRNSYVPGPTPLSSI